MLSNVKSIVSDPDKGVQVARSFVMVQITPNFNQYAVVVKGWPDLCIESYGERGHARSSMGLELNCFDGVV